MSKDNQEIRAGFVSIKGARENNLKNISLDIPRNAFVVFTGVSGSGKSSLAFGTLYAEAQKRYLESVSPYARRLFHQMPVPDVDEINGLPPAVALQQQRGTPGTRSSVASVTTLGNLFRMLYSRAGDYPKNQPLLYAASFSPNTPDGACPQCHGLGNVFEVPEKLMVPDENLTIRERAVAAWPSAWQGQNLRDILTTLGYDVDKPWKDLPKKDREWILFTDDQPKVPVYAGFTRQQVKQAIKQKMEPSYEGTFTGTRRYVMHTFANTQSQLMKKRVAAYMVSGPCPLCHGKRLKLPSLSVKFAGYDIAELAALPLARIHKLIKPYADNTTLDDPHKEQKEKILVRQRIAEDMLRRLSVLLDLGLGYLTLERSTPTLSPGELQRLRLATQVCSNLFGVVYVLDEPSAGLHPADTEALLVALAQLKKSGNSLFIVEHEIEVIRQADWIVDVGPGAGEHGGTILYSGPLEGLRNIKTSQTGLHLFNHSPDNQRQKRKPVNWLRLSNISRNNLHRVDASFPIGLLTCVTGVSGSGKSTLVSQALVELVLSNLGHKGQPAGDEPIDLLSPANNKTTEGMITEGVGSFRRLVTVDQKPIGRSPRSNLATYTGLFDEVRKIYAATPAAKSRKYNAGSFSFNVGKGRCPHCEGEGFVMVELLFLPSVYSPCPVCKGSRYNPKILEIKYRQKHIADVLGMTVEEAAVFFNEERTVMHSLEVLRKVGLGYLRLGQPATELSGGEAQRIKLATEIQRMGNGRTLYILDEPTTGLHPSDVDNLLGQLNGLVNAGNTVIVVEHDMHIIAGSDWVIDIGPGAGEEGGKIIATGTPETVARSKAGFTAAYLEKYLQPGKHRR